MTHLELENLASDYLEGQLDAAWRVKAETHLGECGECRALVAGLRRVIEMCRSAEDLEPPPALIPKILLATVGERRPTLREQIAAFLRPAIQPRFAYALAMAVFSFSIIINAAGINLRKLTLDDLNPRTWVYQANRNGRLLYARAEKFYYDLRVVYEIESRLKQLRVQSSSPSGQQEQETPKQEAPPGGSTDSNLPGAMQLAQTLGPAGLSSDTGGKLPRLVGIGRSPSR